MIEIQGLDTIPKEIANGPLGHIWECNTRQSPIMHLQIAKMFVIPCDMSVNQFLISIVSPEFRGLPIEFYQVGKQTKAGLPVARETRALNDIKVADPTINPLFIPYNK
jgi:hypothetical protein